MDDNELFEMLEDRLKSDEKLGRILKQFNIDNNDYLNSIRQLNATPKITLSGSASIIE